jgi:Ankyrin repeats (3 copies)
MEASSTPELQNEEKTIVNTEDENRRTDTPTPEQLATELLDAVTRSSLPALRRLTRIGVNLEHRYNSEKTVLHLACESSSLDVFEFLLNSGANPEAKDQAGRTPMLCAVEEGHVDILKLLMRKEINTSVKDNEGRTAVLIAAERGDVGILQELYATRRLVPVEHTLAILEAKRSKNPDAVKFLEKEGVRLGFHGELKPTTTILKRSNPPKSIASHCQNFYVIAKRQISDPASLSIYADRIAEASKGIHEGPHNLTVEEGRLFATLYRAIFDDSAQKNKASAESHLTAVKIIAKTLG